MTNYNIEQPEGGVPIKMWTQGVPVEPEARQQLANAAKRARSKPRGAG